MEQQYIPSSDEARAMPCHPESERSVLGAMLRSREAALLMRSLGSALAYVGAASALFGSHGALRRWTQNRPKDPPNDDNPDD